MIRSSLLLWVLLSVNLLFSQQPVPYKITGTVTDNSTDEPIENVHIVVESQKQGTTTNDLGQFTLYITKLPFTLRFSHVSYESYSLKFDYPPERHLEISLIKKTSLLNEVVIVNQKIDTIFKDDFYSVLDYETLDQGILLLIYKARLSRSELRLLDYSGNHKLTLPLLPGKPLALFRDCLGNAHIITKTRVYQVHLTDEYIKLYQGEDVAEFLSTMEGCLFRIDNKLYFEKLYDFDFVKKLYYFNTLDSSYHDFTLMVDQDKIDMLFDNPGDFNIFSNFDNSPNIGNLTGTPGDYAILDNIRDLEAEQRFNKMVYYSPINAPVKKLGDSICVFNHSSNSLDIYGVNDSLVLSTEIAYHLEEKHNPLTTLIRSVAPRKKWLGEVYTDPIKGKMYTLFQNLNGTRDLEEINLLTGATQYKITIPYPFVEKVNIYNGWIYFIYKGWGESVRKKLFRQQI